MEVQLLNPDVAKNIYKEHGKFACVCYATPEKYAERVGKSCVASGHMSGSRTSYLNFRVSEVDRGTAEQCLRHEIGVRVPFDMQNNYDGFTDVIPSDEIIKNMASFRYIDKGGFNYAVPDTIATCPEADHEYAELMKHINETRLRIKDALINSGVPENVANQDANFVLPRATTTEFVIGFTPEALIHFCHKRLCTRAQSFIRCVAQLMKWEVQKVNPEFAELLVPQCEHYLWCPEGKRSCGRRPSKEEVEALIKKGKEK
ncbi:MAG: FAD-dependent thymidylate synthase [Lachnospiraceae bacterium]|nr:FAD-dependent thymidylate synthase [Lachnospiraceae bacterium]